MAFPSVPYKQKQKYKCNKSMIIYVPLQLSCSCILLACLSLAPPILFKWDTELLLFTYLYFTLHAISYVWFICLSNPNSVFILEYLYHFSGTAVRSSHKEKSLKLPKIMEGIWSDIDYGDFIQQYRSTKSLIHFC